MSDKKLTPAEIQELIEKMPKMVQAFETVMDAFVKSFESLAEVIRAIPPELIEKAAKESVEKMLKEGKK